MSTRKLTAKQQQNISMSASTVLVPVSRQLCGNGTRYVAWISSQNVSSTVLQCAITEQRVIAVSDTKTCLVVTSLTVMETLSGLKKLIRENCDMNFL
jgi:cell division inhibitor SulA